MGLKGAKLIGLGSKGLELGACGFGAMDSGFCAEIPHKSDIPQKSRSPPSHKDMIVLGSCSKYLSPK